jgi:hypothetical protein
MSKQEIPLCDPYVWEDPRYLFRSSWLDRYLNRRKGVCASELVNEIIFVYVFSILSGVILSVITNLSSAPLFAGIVATVYLIPTFLKLRDVDAFRVAAADASGSSNTPVEGFAPALSPDFNQVGVKGTLAATSRNPFGNILIDEIKYAPTRPGAPDITTPQSKLRLDDFFRVHWYSDPTDVFGKSQSQRQFATQPITTIPNDQKSYQEWLYKIPGKTCKEGNAKACYGGTNGAAIPWLNT